MERADAPIFHVGALYASSDHFKKSHTQVGIALKLSRCVPSFITHDTLGKIGIRQAILTYQAVSSVVSAYNRC